MPAIQEVVSAMVCGYEQAASTTNGAARVHEAKHHRGHGPLLVRLRGAESEGCKSPPGRRLLPET